MPDTDMISIIIQGGAVGVLLAFGFGTYLLVRRLIDLGGDLISNHLAHLTGTLEKLDTTITRLDSTVDGCPYRKADEDASG